MSQRLRLLRENDVFSHHTLDISDTRHLYQPYSAIVKEPEEEVERRAKEVLAKGKALIVKDNRGTGKSSLVNHVLLDLGPACFPIFFRLGLAGDFDKVSSDPGEFARYLLTRTRAEVLKVKKLSKAALEKYRKYSALEISYTEGRKDTLIGKIKNTLSWIPGLASTEAEVGGELQTYVETALSEKVYNDDRIAAIAELCEVIRAHKLEPVLVFDDTDHFLQQGAIDRRPLVDAFFVNIVPMFQEFGCGTVLNAHSSYDDYETFRAAQKKHFDEVLTIPVVGFEGFLKIVEKKVRAVHAEAALDDLFQRDALETIFHQAYLKKPKERMRDTMLVLQDTVLAAINANADKVSLAHAVHGLFEAGVG
jgi:hypothetical protein